jgi:hypothetical protein
MSVTKLDSLLIYPSNIDVSEEKIGEEKRMDDGTLRFFLRAIKHTFTLSWDAVEASWLPLLRAKSDAGELTYTDEVGSTFDAIVISFDHTLSADKIDKDNTYRYDITMVFKEK